MPCPPEREPDRRRLELPFIPFLGPVPDAPGRFLLFFAPLERRPDVSPRPCGAFGLDPLPLPSLLSCAMSYPTSFGERRTHHSGRYQRYQSGTTHEKFTLNVILQAHVERDWMPACRGTTVSVW